MSRTPSVRKALIIGVTLQLFQQLAGINTVIYYSARYCFNFFKACQILKYYAFRILQMSGISNKVSTILWISCGVNAINFFASFIGRTELLGLKTSMIHCLQACTWWTELGEDC